MGSTCDVSIDGFSVWGTKSYVDDATLSIFHERDRTERVARRPQYGDAEPEPAILYAVSAQAMRERLDAMGYTVAQARIDYVAGLSEEVELYMSPGFSRADRKKVKDWTFDRWSAAIRRLAPVGFQVWNADKFKKDADAERLSDNLQAGLGAYFSDVRFMIRGLLDALPDAKEIVLDVTDLIGAGYYEEGEPICDAARRGWANEYSVFGPILLLTEGKSDTRILKAALDKIAPHLSGLYGFLDFDGLKIEGSVDVLAKTVRAFVGARISSRVIGIFDNDTAGVAAMASLANVDLPSHIKIMALPDCALAHDYPTVGPQGPVRMNVNGLACGIELYLGRYALEDESGALRPVRWIGYNHKLSRYQGVVEGKDEIAKRFLERLARCAGPAEAREIFPDLARTVDAVAAIFAATPPIAKGARQNLSG
ncbi:MAG: HEPN/Toprim-associated domain-containing protein [Pseudomonadota bacterium]